MNFKKDVLLKHIDAALEAHREEYRHRNLDATVAHEEARKKWIAEKGPVWDRFLDKATDALENGRVITVDMLPCDLGYGGRDAYAIAAMCFEDEREPKPYVAPKDLVALRKLIEASVDEIINTKTIGAKRILEILE